MRKDGENLFKWLWRKYNEFYDEAGPSAKTERRHAAAGAKRPAEFARILIFLFQECKYEFYSFSVWPCCWQAISFMAR